MDYSSLADELLHEQMKLFRAKLHRRLYDLSSGEMHLLFLLSEAGGASQPGQMSDAMNVTTACVASTLRSMERKNLIIRETCRQDRRFVDVTITPMGQERLTGVYDNAVEDLRKIMERLGEKDAMEYLSLVGRIARILSEDE